MLTAQRLRELLNYDPETGIVMWIGHGRGIRHGKSAGSHRGRGYLSCVVDGRQYPLHCLIWLWMTGEWPATTIDHKDRVRSNNRWSNLRLATKQQQQENRSRARNNTSGVTGVTRVRYGKSFRWRAQFERKQPDGSRKTFYLGFFDDFELAEFVRSEAERKYFTHSTMI